jgi:hypoxanthine phosphoribosyltransferase
MNTNTCNISNCNASNQLKEFVINDKVFKETISWQVIQQRISEIAKQINIDYQGKQPTFLIAMKGAMFFGVELLKEIQLPCIVEVISAKSYGTNMQSVPDNVAVQHHNIKLENKDVIIVEDIVDTGYTIKKLLEVINNQNPKSIAVAALIAKPEKFCIDVKIDYLGFTVSPEFIIGCGMDYDEFGRNLKGIYTLSVDE